MMKYLKYAIEKQAFGVCSYLGEMFNINSGRIRLYFIYASCLTFGSPLLIYLVLAFWINIKNYIQEKDRSVWDL